MTRLLVCRIGWMQYYAGQTARDRIRGGGRYVDEQGFGWEIYNFLPGRKTLYGYVTSKGDINLERLGAEPGADRVSGVTVVWTARRPKTGGIYVVGWYRNATVFRSYQRTPNDTRRGNPQTRRPLQWNITASLADACLLTDERRVFRIRFGEDSMGMSGTFFPDGSSAYQRDLRRRLLRYIGSGGRQALPRETEAKVRRRGRGGGAGWQTDPFVRAKVERRAIAAVRHRYRRYGYAVRSVERENNGWDLEATLNGRVMHIEVKGSAGDQVRAELTPNEYGSMAERDPDYRLCVVTNALQRPQVSEFRWVAELGHWADDQRRRLRLQQRTGAVVSLS